MNRERTMVDMTAKELARALKNEEGRGVADILYFWLEADAKLRETVLNWPIMKAHFYDDDAPGEYGCDPVNIDTALEDDSPPVYPMDQTRTTNPDGTKTPNGDSVSLDKEEPDLLPPTLPAPDEVGEALRAHDTIPAANILAAAVRQLSHAYDLLYCAIDWADPEITTTAELMGANMDIHAHAHITAAKIEEMDHE